MSRKSRTKGAAAERELIGILTALLPFTKLSRNLVQTRDGGHDIDGIKGWSIEVKRQEKLSIGTWWNQAARQAQASGNRPALAYRRNREPWKILVEMTPEQFAEYIADD